MDGEGLAARCADAEEPVVVVDPLEADVRSPAGDRLELIAIVEAHPDAHGANGSETTGARGQQASASSFLLSETPLRTA